MPFERLAMITQEAAGWQLPDWQQQQRELVTSVDELCALLNLPPQALSMPEAARAFPLRVPRRFVSLMTPGDADDPLLRQVLMHADEAQQVPGFYQDPLDEAAHTPVPGLLHKYHGRALLVVTGACAVHCRYCFRRHFPYQQHLSGKRWQQALDWLSQRSDISEVILSGGDPLTLTNERLSQLIEALAEIPHLRRLRLHSRTPVVIPERLDSGFADVICADRWQSTLVLHANHANEISPAMVSAARALKVRGVNLLNQSVLLAGVNDSVTALEALSEALFSAGILPYYLHMLDPVNGAGHFYVSDERALALHHELRSRLPGYMVPRLSREIPGEPAKTVLAG